jgi:hypothetical protein
MKVELKKSVPMPASPDAVWKFVQNIEAVAGCMPGGKITERLSDSNYKGAVTVRVGPATLSFKGDIQVLDVDAAAKSLRIVGKGSDSTGSSSATMEMSARVAATGDGRSTLEGTSVVTVTGKAVTFGGRMMNAVAEQIIEKFAANLAQQVGSAPGPAGAAAGASELNALELAWGVVKRWFARLFGKKEA